MNVATILSRHVEWIAPDATLTEAARRLLAAPSGTTALLVGAPGAPPLGILTGFDVLRASLETALQPGRIGPPGERVTVKDLGREALYADMARAAATMTVREVMSSPVRGLPETASICEAIDLLVRGRIEQAPVLRGGRVVGMLERRALLRALEVEMECAPPEASQR